VAETKQGSAFTVSHFPPGTSKGNKIEHDFLFITELAGSSVGQTTKRVVSLSPRQNDDLKRGLK